MRDILQTLENEIFEKYPDWVGKLKFIDYLSGSQYGKGSPYVIVDTPYARHKVSVGNLRKGNFPTNKTALDPNGYDKNFNFEKIKEFEDVIFALKPEWKTKLELIQYIQGKTFKINEIKSIDGGPFLKVKTEVGIHIVTVSGLRKGYFPSINSAIELLASVEKKEINFTDLEVLKEYIVVKRFYEVEELAEYMDVSQIDNEKIRDIKKERLWYLVKNLKTEEYFFQRKASIKGNSTPSVKSAFNEISYLNKITPNDKRKFPIVIIKRIENIREELAYEIEWCGCRFKRELSWILNKIGREPRQLKGSVLSLEETANGVFRFRNPETSTIFKIITYIKDKNCPRVILRDTADIEYDFPWYDILEGKTPGLRSAVNMEAHILREMKEKNSRLINDIQILGFSDIKGKSNAQKIKVIYNPYCTEHIVHKSVLISGAKLTIGSAINKRNFLISKIQVDFPELASKIEIKKIEEATKKTKRSNYEKESQVTVYVFKTGKEHTIPLTYLQNNHYLSAVLDEWTHIPIHAIIRIDPAKFLNFYFIQLVHISGYQSYKIGWTLYDTPDRRVKTIGNGWNIYHCICFEPQSAIDIYNLEEQLKKIVCPDIPNECKPNNGFSEFIWNKELEEKWSVCVVLKKRYRF